jgi:ferredoxin
MENKSDNKQYNKQTEDRSEGRHTNIPPFREGLGRPGLGRPKPPKISAQINMVLNLDKCIGCHTCSVTCKNVWTSREGLEYAWFNNVETKPGPGYPKRWEDQDKYKGGWELKGGKLQLRLGNRPKIMSQIFSNPYLPQVKDYYGHSNNSPWIKSIVLS